MDKQLFRHLTVKAKQLPPFCPSNLISEQFPDENGVLDCLFNPALPKKYI